MRIVVLDTLIQTVNFDKPVRGGLVKAVWNDVIALAERHEVFYMYYGKADYQHKFTPIVLGKTGVKDTYVKKGKKTSMAHHEIKRETPKIINKIASIDPDVLIVNVESKSVYLEEIAKRFKDTPKIFVFYDAISNNDLFGSAGIIDKIIKLKKYNAVINTISEYTKDRIQEVLVNREVDLRKYYTFMEEIDDVHTYELFDTVCDHFVYYDNKTELEIVKNAGFSVNIGRFQKKKGVLDLLQLHKYNNHEVRLYGVKDPVWDEGLKDYQKILDAAEMYEDNYTICEGFSDDELREDAKHGNNIVISCPVEGFGYTAFEMGIYGMPCVILKQGDSHATEDYLEKAGAAYISIDKKGNKKWREELYEAMMTTKLSLTEKEENAQKLLEYFTLDNYIDERERFIQIAIDKVNDNKKKTLF